jgi:hypothetical protein
MLTVDLSRRRLVVSCSLALILLGSVGPIQPLALGQQGIVNPWSAGQQPEIKAFDPSQPVGRGYIIPSSRTAPGGAEVVVDIFHNQLNSPVTLVLQALIDPRSSSRRVRPRLLDVAVLSDQVADNPNSYHSRRVFQLDYNAINAKLATAFSNAPNIRIGPGSPLFVYALWNASGHQWGGVDRSGIFFLPGHAPTAADGDVARATLRRPEALDMSFPITSSFAAQFNDPVTQAGLKVNGAIRSRVEGEGKFQVRDEDFSASLRRLLSLANSPNEVTSLLGPGWKLALEDRYLLKHSNGRLKLDSKGLPMPDPMVDTYYDDASFRAAENDVAIRYRFTAQNQTGAWNIKPGASLTDADGVTYRVEYGVDTTSDSPRVIEKFADSTDPLNPFSRISRAIPGARPSDFLQPAVKITDYRYKFKLEHTSGLIVEISMDDVRAENLRSATSPRVRYFQVEMDIDHLATQSTNVQSGNSISSMVRIRLDRPTSTDKRNMTAVRAEAVLDGRPVMHEIEDLDPNSLVRQRNKADFDMATQAIKVLRDQVVGSSWLPGAQKYAWAVRELGLTKQQSSKSVASLLEAQRAQRRDPQAQARACLAQVM